MAQQETETIGRLLLERGLVSSEQLTSAGHRQQQLAGSLGTALLEMGALSEQQLGSALAEHTELPQTDIDELSKVPPEVVQLLPAKAAIRHNAIPFRSGRGRVYLAVQEEPEIPALDELSFVIGRRIVLHIATEARIQEALGRYYGHACPVRFSHLLDRLNHARDNPSAEPEADAAPAEAPPSPPSPPSPPAAPSATKRAPIRQPARPRPTSVPLSQDEKKALRHLEARDAVKPLSQDGIQRALQAAHTAEDIGIALLGFLGQEFLRLLLFRVGQGKVRGWLGRSPTLDEYAFRNWTVGFDEPSVFLNLRQGAEFFLGRLPEMPAHERLLNCWRGSLETECAVFPVKVRNRLVCAIYGDRDSLGLAGLDVPAIQRLTAKTSIAFEMLLMQRKLRS